MTGTAATRSAGETLVRRLLAVVSGDAPMAEARALLAPGVICHMDQYTTRGADVWLDWVAFLRSRAGGPVTAGVDHVVTNADGTVTAFGALRKARAIGLTDPTHQARYRIDAERIAEIWTTRENYETILGPARRPARWLLVLVQFALWRRLPWGGRTR